jgi:hypothetical protein
MSRNPSYDQKRVILASAAGVTFFCWANVILDWNVFGGRDHAVMLGSFALAALALRYFRPSEAEMFAYRKSRGYGWGYYMASAAATTFAVLVATTSRVKDLIRGGEWVQLSAIIIAGMVGGMVLARYHANKHKGNPVDGS